MSAVVTADTSCALHLCSTIQLQTDPVEVKKRADAFDISCSNLGQEGREKKKKNKKEVDV